VGDWRIIFTLRPNQEPRTVDINDIRRSHDDHVLRRTTRHHADGSMRFTAL